MPSFNNYFNDGFFLQQGRRRFRITHFNHDPKTMTTKGMVA